MRPCPYVTREQGELACRIQSRPSLFRVTPDICERCPIPRRPCRHLRARVLVGEDLAGRPSAVAIDAACDQNRGKVDTRDFALCLNCEGFQPEPLGHDIDRLTGLLRREYWQDELERQLDQARRASLPLAVLIADIDHFKRINDQHGHATGDAVLRGLGALLARTVGHKGLVGRWGGEELVVALPNFARREAEAMAEQFREAAATAAVPDLRTPPTVSIGVALFPDDAATGADLLHCADQALYQAKRSGRNRTVVFDAARGMAEETVELEVDFVGNADLVGDSLVRIEEYYTYPSNARKLRALRIVDEARHVVSIGERDPLLGKPPVTAVLEGRIVSVSKAGSRTYCIVAVPRSHFDRLHPRAAHRN